MTPLMRNVATFSLLLIVVADANAFFWLRIGALARGAAASGVRAETQAALGTRVCVRPLGANVCDFRIANSGREAVTRALGSGYRVSPTSRPNIFEIFDVSNNFIGLIQSVSEADDPSISGLPQYQTNENLPSGIYSNTSAYILRHNGDILNLRINGNPIQVWSDGFVEIWTDNEPERITLNPGQKANVFNQGVVYAVPKSSNAYTLFIQPNTPSVNNNESGLSNQNCASGYRMINGQWICADRRGARENNENSNLSSGQCSSGFQMINGRWTCMGNTDLSPDNCQSGFLMINGRWVCRGN